VYKFEIIKGDLHWDAIQQLYGEGYDTLHTEICQNTTCDTCEPGSEDLCEVLEECFDNLGECLNNTNTLLEQILEIVNDTQIDVRILLEILLEQGECDQCQLLLDILANQTRLEEMLNILINIEEWELVVTLLETIVSREAYNSTLLINSIYELISQESCNLTEIASLLNYLVIIQDWDTVIDFFQILVNREEYNSTLLISSIVTLIEENKCNLTQIEALLQYLVSVEQWDVAIEFLEILVNREEYNSTLLINQISVLITEHSCNLTQVVELLQYIVDVQDWDTVINFLIILESREEYNSTLIITTLTEIIEGSKCNLTQIENLLLFLVDVQDWSTVIDFLVILASREEYNSTVILSLFNEVVTNQEEILLLIQNLVNQQNWTVVISLLNQLIIKECCNVTEIVNLLNNIINTQGDIIVKLNILLERCNST